MAIQWPFNGHSVAIQWPFNGHSMAIQWPFCKIRQRQHQREHLQRQQQIVRGRFPVAALRAVAPAVLSTLAIL
eukprot:8973388-Lingulodinium_polyedra.AAC.1